MVRADQIGGCREKLAVGGVAANGCEQGKLLERAIQGSGVPASLGRNRALAFQCPGLRRGLLRGLFRFGREVGGEPVDDSAFERRRAVTLSYQLRDDVRARQLVGIGVVYDNFLVARQRLRRGTFGVSDGARQADRAVLVRVFQPRVHQDRGHAAFEFLFEIFLGNPRDGHAGIVFAPREHCQRTSGLRLICRDAAEGQNA